MEARPRRPSTSSTSPRLRHMLVRPAPQSPSFSRSDLTPGESPDRARTVVAFRSDSCTVLLVVFSPLIRVPPRESGPPDPGPDRHHGLRRVHLLQTLPGGAQHPLRAGEPADDRDRRVGEVVRPGVQLPGGGRRHRGGGLPVLRGAGRPHRGHEAPPSPPLLLHDRLVHGVHRAVLCLQRLSGHQQRAAGAPPGGGLEQLSEHPEGRGEELQLLRLQAGGVQLHLRRCLLPQQLVLAVRRADPGARGPGAPLRRRPGPLLQLHRDAGGLVHVPVQEPERPAGQPQRLPLETPVTQTPPLHCPLTSALISSCMLYYEGVFI